MGGGRTRDMYLPAPLVAGQPARQGGQAAGGAGGTRREGAAQPGFVPSFGPTLDATVDVATLSWFAAGRASRGEGAALATVAEAVGRARLEQAAARLVQHMTDEKLVSAMCRLCPQGSPHDSVEMLRWFPASWPGKGFSAEALRQHGAPWLLVGQLGSCRLKPVSWPFYSQAAYLHVLDGEVLVMAWPTKAILETGTPIGESGELLQAMGTQTFETFCKDSVQYVRLDKGTGLWVPNGVQIAMVTLGDRTLPRQSVVSQVLYVPVMSGSMLGRSPERREIVAYAAFNARMQLRSGTQSWLSWVADFVQWLAGVDEEAAREGNSSGDQLPEHAIVPHRP